MADNNKKEQPPKQNKGESKEQKPKEPKEPKEQKEQKEPKEPKEQKEQPKDNKPQKDVFVRETGRGIVKSVPSGDTIVVLHLDKAHQGPPVERQITLGNLQAPLLRRRGNDKDKKPTQDEPFAWASREFLRKKCIGRQVQYTVDFKNPSGREYGVVQLLSTTGEEPENLTRLVVSNGWAKVKRPTKEGQVRPEIQELIDLEEQASNQGKGIFSKDHDDLEKAKRPPQPESLNPASVYEQYKGRAQSGVVENVRTGSSLRVTLLPSFTEVNLYLSGVQAPEYRPDGEFEPFGREAKFFTEHHILNRDVSVILEGVDKFNVYGTVSALGHNLSEELLKNGLGKYVEWSGARTAFSAKLQEAEKSAKEKKLRIWTNYVPEVKAKDDKKGSPASPKSDKEFHARVVEVLAGGVLTVIDGTGKDHKVNLSSIRVPRMLKEKEEAPKEEKEPIPGDNKNKDKKEKRSKESIERAYAFEAREFLRKRLIGQRVKIVFDYTRGGPNQQQFERPGKKPQQQQQQPQEERSFFSVYVDNKNNVAVELVEAGLAWAQEHRGGELRSKDYEHILLAEERAKKLSRGVYGPESKAPSFHIKDVSQMEVSKARQYLPFLKRAGRLRGVVEYEFSASRLKIYVPKESCTIAFSLAAVRAPTRNDPYAKEALTFVRDTVHQHDVEFEVLSQDRGGSFLGNLWINKKNLATILLEHGFAEVAGGVKENENSTEYIIAEESAKRVKKNIWKNYDPKVEEEERKKRQAAREESLGGGKKDEHPDVVVTEVLDGNRFYVQFVGADAEQLEELMKNLSVETSDEPYKPTVGQLVKAQFVDDAWYRAKVVKITPEGEYEVFYIDYGNREVLSASKLRALDPSFAELAPQAREGRLAYVKAPKLDEDYGTDAAVFLRDLVAGKQMMASLEYKVEDVLYFSLIDRDTQQFVNAAMLRAGLARVERVRNKHAQPLIEKLKDEEDKARQSHMYIWEYGDPGSDDEDEKKEVAKVEKKAPTKPKEERKK